MNFHSIYDQGFARVATITLPVHAARPAENAAEIIDAARECDAQSVALALFPELCVSGYAIDDLLLQDVLLDQVESALADIRRASEDLLPVLVVGAPLRVGNRLYNCAVAIQRGRVLAVVPKVYLPTYREFYEARWFASGEASDTTVITDRWLSDEDDPDGFPLAPFGPAVLTAADVPGLAIGIEICEDMWVPIPPATLAALHGATVICNLSASPITVGRSDDRRLLVKSASARTNVAYLYAAAGPGESTTDLSWDGQTMIYEMGDLLAEGPRFPDGRTITIADVDLDRMRQERQRQGTFDDNDAIMGAGAPSSIIDVAFELDPPRDDIGLRRDLDRYPFVPDDPAKLEQDCYEAYNIQVSGLEQRLRAIGNPKVVIGVSGGLDSTHALIVAAKAMERLGRPRSDILAFTMPGFATSDHTKNNAIALCEALDIPVETIDITGTATTMLGNMGHPFADGKPVYDVTFENVQAGLRTDYLFRIANQRGGIVLGTGDLSELALGWCTYGVGDQMSHYAVNTGVPKTMIQHLIRWVMATKQFEGNVDEVLNSILDTEISPELVPGDAAGDKGIQSTEDKIGPYNLQDFTLFHVLRRGYRPSKIAFLAEKAWSDASSGAWPPGFPDAKKVSYSLDEIVKWERLFLHRFFTQQFKRSCIPNGPKVMAGGSLSPRGDWRMPSDVSGAAWIAELDEAVKGLISVDEGGATALGSPSSGAADYRGADSSDEGGAGS